jgi:hypothetical protein
VQALHQEVDRRAMARAQREAAGQATDAPNEKNPK